AWFQPTVTGVDMNVHVAAGSLPIAAGTVSQAAQVVTLAAAPTSNSRIDLVVVNRLTGVASVITGAVAASPVPPSCPASSLPILLVSVAANITAITSAMCIDGRLPGGGAGGQILSLVSASAALSMSNVG